MFGTTAVPGLSDLTGFLVFEVFDTSNYGAIRIPMIIDTHAIQNR